MKRKYMISGEERSKIINYLRLMPAYECEQLLNSLFIMKDPSTGKALDLQMHQAIIYKIQRRMDKRSYEACGLKSIGTFREYLDRGLFKVYNYLKNKGDL